jgi:RNA polymerase sigma-70 factor (ECF subfamily)
MSPLEQRERFERWVQDHRAILHHVANGFAEGDDRNDLMQELLLAVWKSIPAFRHGAQPSTFIYRVSHNAALTWKRTQRNYRARLERFQSEPAVAAPAPPDASDQDLLDRLYAEIRKLPPVDRSLALLMLDGVSYAAMAEIHGLTESNVGVRLHRLKQKLTDAMKGAVHGPR